MSPPKLCCDCYQPKNSASLLPGTKKLSTILFAKKRGAEIPNPAKLCAVLFSKIGVSEDCVFPIEARVLRVDFFAKKGLTKSGPDRVSLCELAISQTRDLRSVAIFGDSVRMSATLPDFSRTSVRDDTFFPIFRILPRIKNYFRLF